MPTFDSEFGSLFFVGLFFSGTPYLDLEVDPLSEFTAVDARTSLGNRESDPPFSRFLGGFPEWPGIGNRVPNGPFPDRQGNGNRGPDSAWSAGERDSGRARASAMDPECQLASCPVGAGPCVVV